MYKIAFRYNVWTIRKFETLTLNTAHEYVIVSSKNREKSSLL